MPFRHACLLNCKKDQPVDQIKVAKHLIDQGKLRNIAGSVSARPKVVVPQHAVPRSNDAGHSNESASRSAPLPEDGKSDRPSPSATAAASSGWSRWARTSSSAAAEGIASSVVTSLAALAVAVVSLAESAGAVVAALQESAAGEATGAGAAVVSGGVTRRFLYDLLGLAAAA
jgi:hypothetical protein